MDGGRFFELLRSFRYFVVEFFNSIIDQLLVLLEVELFVVGDRRNYGSFTHILLFRIAELG